MFNWTEDSEGAWHASYTKYLLNHNLCVSETDAGWIHAYSISANGTPRVTVYIERDVYETAADAKAFAERVHGSAET